MRGQQAALGNDLLALRDAPGIRRALLVVGLGARSACVVSALHPERVTGLVVGGEPGYNNQNETASLTLCGSAWERLHCF